MQCFNPRLLTYYCRLPLPSNLSLGSLTRLLPSPASLQAAQGSANSLNCLTHNKEAQLPFKELKQVCMHNKKAPLDLKEVPLVFKEAPLGPLILKESPLGLKEVPLIFKDSKHLRQVLEAEVCVKNRHRNTDR